MPVLVGALVLVDSDHRQCVSQASVAERPIALPPVNRSARMCEKCIELDKKIEHYQELSSWVLDQIALEGIRFLVAKYKADKKALHEN
jgi:hypothetical protein